MGKREDWARQLRPLLENSEAFQELERFLTSNSNLPGPRGNLELAAAFAGEVAARGAGAAPWEPLFAWTRIPAAEAPTGDPREFLPFCALGALGSLYPEAPAERRERIVEALKAAAGDPRWRVREGCAIAFQGLAERDFEEVRRLFTFWLEDASLPEQRALLAALAHPPVLGEPDRVRFCLGISDAILRDLLALDREARRTEEFRILRLGLEYALSVFVERLPGEGFAFLERWAAEPDPDVERIVRSNLGKARLAKKYAEEVQRVLSLLPS